MMSDGGCINANLLVEKLIEAFNRLLIKCCGQVLIIFARFGNTQR
jgi:hypothetical protein